MSFSNFKTTHLEQDYELIIKVIKMPFNLQPIQY